MFPKVSKNNFLFTFTFTFHGGMMHDISQTFNRSSQYPSWRFLIGGRTNSRSIFVISHDVGMFHWRMLQPPAFRQNCTSLWSLCNLLIIHSYIGHLLFLILKETCSKPIKKWTKNPPYGWSIIPWWYHHLYFCFQVFRFPQMIYCFIYNHLPIDLIPYTSLRYYSPTIVHSGRHFCLTFSISLITQFPN